MPNQENLRPHFQHVKNKRQRDASMSSDGGDDTKKEEKSQQERIDSEVELIMQVLGSKGDVTQSLSELLNDMSRISSEGNLLSQILIEIVMTKYGTHTLEHLQRGFDKIQKVLSGHFGDNQQAQRVALETIFKSFNMDSLASQDFSKENLFQLRSKVESLVLLFVQSGLVRASVAVDWLVEQMEKYEGEFSLHFTHSHLILMIVDWIQCQRENVTTVFLQEFDKLGEQKQETPYEQRLREQAEAEGRDWTQSDSLKPRTPEQIQAEREELEKRARDRFAELLSQESEGVVEILKRLEQVPKLESLCRKVALASTHLRLVQTNH